jgi:hypothetical protein
MKKKVIRSIVQLRTTKVLMKELNQHLQAMATEYDLTPSLEIVLARVAKIQNK